MAYLTPADVAAIWRYHPRTVRRLAEQGKLRGLRVGDLWRFNLADVEAYERQASPEPVSVSASPTRAAVYEAGEYEPVVKGPVPWRDDVIAASSAATGVASGRTTRNRKTASVRT